MAKLNLNLLRMGYFIVYKTPGGFFSNQIVKRQLKEGFSEEDSQYTHIEVSGGSKHSVNISPPFSKLVDITKRHKGRYAKVIRYRNDDYEQKKRYKVAYFSATLCNKGYDIPGILSFIFKWVKHSNRLYFCSEGAAWALQMCFYKAFHGQKPHYIMPADFLNKREFEQVWEGEIC